MVGSLSVSCPSSDGWVSGSLSSVSCPAKCHPPPAVCVAAAQMVSRCPAGPQLRSVSVHQQLNTNTIRSNPKVRSDAIAKLARGKHTLAVIDASCWPRSGAGGDEPPIWPPAGCRHMPPMIKHLSLSSLTEHPSAIWTLLHHLRSSAFITRWAQ